MNETNKEVVFVGVTDNEQEVIGITGIGFYKDSTIGNYYGIHYVSVDPKFRNKGYGSKLAEEIFKYCQRKGVQIVNSQYTDMGRSFLKSSIDKLRKKYSNVKFLDYRNEDDY